MNNIKTLGNELTKNNQTCTVKTVNVIGDTPVLPLFLKNYAALIEKGYAPQVMNGTNQSKAVYVEINNQIVGHIVFDVMKDSFNTAYIILSCVDEKYQNQGIYKIMFKHFESIVKKLGSTKILSFIHADNQNRLAIWKSVGMIPQFYRMEKRI